MANMIPEKPRDFDPASQEGVMFDALSSLPDDYYVFHSFKITCVNDNVFRESETDFIIYNRKKGVLCLEAKAGQIRYENGVWKYGNGIPMHNGGPFNQAASNKYTLMKYITKSSMASILDKCKFLHAVWFPSIGIEQLRTMILPSEADKQLILTKEALRDPEPFFDRIFSIELPNGKETVINEQESKRLIREVLCPQFNVFPSASFEADLKKIVFHRMLKEQSGILNFLDEQRTAAINGAAGTGKTMIAAEKAQRHAAAGEKVLFLCFNAALRDYLEKAYSHELITYNTVAGFACKLCGTAVPDYNRAKSVLEDMYISGSFPYRHIIVDEAQDFGSEIIEEADILRILYDIVTDESIDGTFYVFYDRLQLIQSREVPKLIEGLDCKLTLYRNCRNTENIAAASLRPITERKPKLFEGAIKGAPARIHFCQDEVDEKDKIDLAIGRLTTEGYKDIVILTCKTESNSVLSPYISDGKYRVKYLFTSCRKFKGLEADAVILIDVDEMTFSNENVLIYYVGASRARLKLDIMTILSDDGCERVLKNVLHYDGRIRKAKKDFAGAMNAIGSISE